MWELAVWSNRFHINPIILDALMAKALRQHPPWMSGGVLTLCIQRSFSLLLNSCIEKKCIINYYNEDIIMNLNFGYLLDDKFQCSFLQLWCIMFISQYVIFTSSFDVNFFFTNEVFFTLFSQSINAEL